MDPYSLEREELPITDPEKYDLYHVFDVHLHKKKYIHYLEVCIDKDGVVHYGVPSHQEYLIIYLCKKFKISREQLYEKYKKHLFDFMDAMMKDAEMVLVWTNGYKGNPNEKQKATIKMLIEEGVLECTE